MYIYVISLWSRCNTFIFVFFWYWRNCIYWSLLFVADSSIRDSRELRTIFDRLQLFKYKSYILLELGQINIDYVHDLRLRIFLSKSIFYFYYRADVDVEGIFNLSLGFFYNFFVGRYNDFFLSITNVYWLFFYPVSAVIVLLKTWEVVLWCYGYTYFYSDTFY